MAGYLLPTRYTERGIYREYRGNIFLKWNQNQYHLKWILYNQVKSHLSHIKKPLNLTKNTSDGFHMIQRLKSLGSFPLGGDIGTIRYVYVESGLWTWVYTTFAWWSSLEGLFFPAFAMMQRQSTYGHHNLLSRVCGDSWCKGTRGREIKTFHLPRNEAENIQATCNSTSTR